ncbi:MAG: hypothetical protein MUO76_13115, partial [Anaerolineaceae bacterium]|nr:hypothetical protein [Anaerolineaceae bacterium]
GISKMPVDEVLTWLDQDELGCSALQMGAGGKTIEKELVKLTDSFPVLGDNRSNWSFKDPTLHLFLFGINIPKTLTLTPDDNINAKFRLLTLPVEPGKPII